VCTVEASPAGGRGAERDFLLFSFPAIAIDLLEGSGVGGEERWSHLSVTALEAALACAGRPADRLRCLLSAARSPKAGGGETTAKGRRNPCTPVNGKEECHASRKKHAQRGETRRYRCTDIVDNLWVCRHDRHCEQEEEKTPTIITTNKYGYSVQNVAFYYTRRMYVKTTINVDTLY
jgi:hypothetical protein